jgi:glycosyltransferase involved in cell wall biosynthesis
MTEANDHPLVSVIMAAYNAAEHIGEALDSVLAQDWQPLEVVVVDDGSADDTATIVARYPDVVYVHQDNKGPSAARNSALNTVWTPVANLDSEIAAGDESQRPGQLSPRPSRGRRGLRPASG